MRVQRIALLGAESTGKTTLAQALASAYRTVWVPEYLREWVAVNDRLPRLGDVETIAAGQTAAEDRLAKQANRLLFCDTTLLMTEVYNRFYLHACPEPIVRASHDRTYDLYLLAGTDIPWKADFGQRDAPEARDAVQHLIVSELEDRGISWTALPGSLTLRLQVARQAIDRLLAV